MTMTVPTMPGRVEALTACSNDASAPIASSCSGLAKSRTGTRMSGRTEAGISHSKGPRRLRSLIATIYTSKIMLTSRPRTLSSMASRW